MLAGRLQDAAQVDNRRGIQMQDRHGGTTRGSPSRDVAEVRAPVEVARPPLTASIGQGNGSPGLWIACVGLDVLATGARRAPGTGRARRQMGRTRRSRDDGSIRSSHRRGRAPAAGPAAGSLDAPSVPPLGSISAITVHIDFPLGRASSASASARAASIRWISCPRAWYSADSSGVSRPGSLLAISLWRRRSAVAGSRAGASRTNVASPVPSSLFSARPAARRRSNSRCWAGES
jgi:hypothetical protein